MSARLFWNAFYYFVKEGSLLINDESASYGSNYVIGSCASYYGSLNCNTHSAPHL